MATKTVREKAQAYYRLGGVTYAQVAKKFGIGKRTVDRWASQDGWQDDIKDIGDRVAVKVAEKIAEKKATKILSNLEYLDEALDRLYNSLNIEPKSLEGVAGAIARLIQIKEELLQRLQVDQDLPALKIVFTTEINSDSVLEVATLDEES